MNPKSEIKTKKMTQKLLTLHQMWVLVTPTTAQKGIGSTKQVILSRTLPFDTNFVGFGGISHDSFGANTAPHTAISNKSMAAAAQRGL